MWQQTEIGRKTIIEENEAGKRDGDCESASGCKLTDLGVKVIGPELPRANYLKFWINFRT